MFRISKGKKEINDLLKTNNHADLISAVLGKISAIDAWSGNKSNYFSDLNRHEVMHGLNHEYGKEINSLKALSLLSFVSYFIAKA